MRLAKLIAFLFLAPAGVAACGSDEGGDGTFDREEFAFTFSYPDDFEETDDVAADQQLGAQAAETAAVALDDDNGIIVQSFTLNIAVDESNLDLAQSELDRLVRQADPGASSEPTEVAGLPALEVSGLDVPTVENGTSRLTAIFDGDQEYYLNCQWTPAEEDAVNAACDQALDTFAVK